MAIIKRARAERSGAEDTPAETPTPPAAQPQRRAPGRSRVTSSWPVLLLRTAHPRQALLTAVGVSVAAALAGRPLREIGLVLATVLVGQAVLGWHNDLVDRERDQRHDPDGKPIAGGLLDAGTAWFALVCGLLLVVPLSVSNGVTAGSAYLISLVVGLLGNVLLRRGLLSWLPWAVSFALYPAFLSYGGWDGSASGSPPEISMTVLAALLGVGAHFLRALPGLVADHEDGWRSLPLRVALRTGATRLLIISLAWTALVVAGLLVTGDLVGLSQ
ncbi:UbiA family prenyltransferase [Nocardioides ungokensis]